MYKCQFPDGAIAYYPDWCIYSIKINMSGRKVLEYKDSSGTIKHREIEYLQAVRIGEKI